LAAARAVIFAQMVDDPSSRPDLFPTEKKQEKEGSGYRTKAPTWTARALMAWRAEPRHTSTTAIETPLLSTIPSRSGPR